VRSKQHRELRNIFESTRALFLFGTPHGGMEVKELLEVTEELSRKNIVQLLESSSFFLEDQREEIINLWDAGSDVKIFSFYEDQLTGTVTKA